MNDLHRSLGHIGGFKLWLLFRESFFCKKDRILAKKCVRSCIQCNLGKVKNHTNQNFIKSIVVQNKLDLVTGDYIGNLIPGDYEYKNIFVLVDIFSKFIRLFPTVQYNTETSLQCIENFIRHQGQMTRILVDNATYFRNEKFKSALERRGIEVVYCSIRHPCANPTERYIMEVTKYIRLKTHDNHSDWVRYVEEIENIMNNTPHTVTEEAPYFVMYEKEPMRPWDPIPAQIPEQEIQRRIERVREKLQVAADKYVRTENRKIKKRTVFRVDDVVMVKRYNLGRRDKGKCAKLELPYVGPYRISRCFGEVTYELISMDGRKKKGRYHISSIFPYPNLP